MYLNFYMYLYFFVYNINVFFMKYTKCLHEIYKKKFNWNCFTQEIMLLPEATGFRMNLIPGKGYFLSGCWSEVSHNTHYCYCS